MTSVSVIVPVFDPGNDIDELLVSLLGQTMPAPARELVFVDDGSRDGTGERLDRLAAEQPGVHVIHIANSRWPGRPRNVGLDAATGEFVFFADNDDWLERDALETLVTTARRERADVVVGKVVGHPPRRVPRGAFAHDRHGLDAGTAPLALLTPHKLFRRALLMEHGIRFPEGEQRLEDHLFVVAAYLAAERISVLASRPVYHWVDRGRRAASRRRPEVENHFAGLRALLDLVDGGTEPGRVRDRYYLHWYRGKVLKRLGRVTGHFRDPEYRSRFDAEARRFIDERIPPRLDEALPYEFRLRARLARRGDMEGLARLVAFTRRLEADARATRARTRSGTALIGLSADLRRRGRPAIRVAHQGKRLLWAPPQRLRLHLTEADREVTAALNGGARVLLQSRETGAEWPLATRATLVLPPAADGVRVAPRVEAECRVDPAVAAAGAPLTPGGYEVRAVVSLASYFREGPVLAGGEPLTLTVSRRGRARVSRRVPRSPMLVVRARRAVRRALRRARRS